MVDGIDSDAIKQITTNVHDKPTMIFIPCVKTYGDFIGTKDSNFFDSTDIFFEWAAYHKSQGMELNQRKDPVRVFRTSTIRDSLVDFANECYQTNGSLSIRRAVELISGATEPEIFESVMKPQLSVFETAFILREECKDSAKITIISNDPNIQKHKKNAESENENDISTNIDIINTNEWLENCIKNRQEDVMTILFSKLEEKGQVKVGNKFYSIGSSVS